MKRPFVLAVLAYLVPTFIAGFVWHLIAFHDVYTRLNIYRPDPIIPLGLGSMFVQAMVFAWIYPKLFDTGPGAWLRGAWRAGLLYAGLSWSFTTLAVAAKHQMASVPAYFVIETAFTIVQFLMVAPLMAWAWRDRSPRVA